MKKRLSPQEKKIQSYVHDQRNMYGESRTSSIKSIRRRKAFVNRHFRRTSAQNFRSTQQTGNNELVEEVVERVSRKQWKKVPDQPLVKYVENQLQYRRNHNMQVQPKRSDLMLEAKRRLYKRRAMR